MEGKAELMSETTNESTTTDAAEGNESFNPISTQEDLDKIISARLERERGKYADYSDLKAKAARLDELEEANKTELEKAHSRAEKAEAKLKELEHTAQVREWKDEVAKELGVPSRALAGNSLDEIKAHGAVLAELLQPQAGESQRVVVRSEREPDLPLNGDGIENALRGALGIG